MFVIVLFIFIFLSFSIKIKFSENNEYIFDESQVPIIIIDHKSRYLFVSLSLEIGSIDDPKEYSGCVHLLEHIICTPGSIFYKFIVERGGYVEARTEDRMLYIEFKVLDDFFEESIDLFYKNLIELEFSEDIIKEEIEQIDQEFFYRKHKFSRASNIHGEIENEGIFNCGNKDTLSKPDIGLILFQKFKECMSSKISIVILTSLSCTKKNSLNSSNITAFELNKHKATKIINILKKNTAILQNKWNRRNTSVQLNETPKDLINLFEDLKISRPNASSFDANILEKKVKDKDAGSSKRISSSLRKKKVEKLGTFEFFKIRKALFIINSKYEAVHLDIRIPLILNNILLEMIMFLFQDQLKIIYGDSLESIQCYYSYECNDIYVHFTFVFKEQLPELVYMIIYNFYDIIAKEKASLIEHIQKRFSKSSDFDVFNFKVIHNLIKFFNSNEYTSDNKNNNMVDCIQILKAFVDIENYSLIYECRITDFKITKHYKIEYKVIDNFLKEWMLKSFTEIKKQTEDYLKNIDMYHPKLHQGSFYSKAYENYEVNRIIADNDITLLQIFTEPNLVNYINLCILFEYINFFLRNELRNITRYKCDIYVMLSNNKIDVEIKGEDNKSTEVLCSFLDKFHKFIIKHDSMQLKCKMIRNLILNILEKYESIPFIAKEVYKCDYDTLYNKLLEILKNHQEANLKILIDDHKYTKEDSDSQKESSDCEHQDTTRFPKNPLNKFLTFDDLSNVSDENVFDDVRIVKDYNRSPKEFKNILKMIPVYTKVNIFSPEENRIKDRFKHYVSMFPLKTNLKLVEVDECPIFPSITSDVFNNIFCFLDLRVIKKYYSDPLHVYFINYCCTYFLYKHSDYLKKTSNLGYCVTVTFNFHDFHIEINTCKDFSETSVIIADYVNYVIKKIKTTKNPKEILYKIFEFTNDDIYDFYYHFNFRYHLKTVNKEFRKFLERKYLFEDIIKIIRISLNVFFHSEIV